MGTSFRPTPPKAVKKHVASIKHAPKRAPSSSSSNSTTGSREARVLGALAQLRNLGIHAPSRKLVMVMAGYSNWESFKVMIGAERRKGIVEFLDGETMTATAAGLAQSPKVDALTSNEELQSKVKTLMKIPGGVPSKVFDYLRDGRGRTKAALAAHCGYDEKNASFSVSLRKASANGVIERKDDLYRLSDICFLPGRRAT